MLGAIVRATTEPRILQIDLLATDFFRPAAWPTFLCYNPHPEERSVFVVVPSGGKLTRDGRRLVCDGIVIDWNVMH